MVKGYCPLASGSKGNSLYIATDNVKILVDVGLSTSALEQRLAQIGVMLSEIDAVMITHEHIDHIRALPVLLKKYNIPVFANIDTAKAIGALLPQRPKFKIFSTGEKFVYGDIEIQPFTVSHDAIDPVMFTFKVDGKKLGLCTDLGFVSTLVTNELKDSDYLIVEANHEPQMVHASPRSYVYKNRVLGRQGHISNEECARLLLDVCSDKLKHVHLAHLSSECNAPQRALDTILNVLQARGCHIPVAVAPQDQNGTLINFNDSCLISQI